MLDTGRVTALLGRARRRRRDGSRGWWSRRALRELLQAGDRGDERVTDALWNTWLEDPDETWWAALRRWARTAGGPDRTNWPSRYGQRVREWSQVALDRGDPDRVALELAEAADRDDHPIGATARRRILTLRGHPAIDRVCGHVTGYPRLAEFLVRERIEPADPLRRAKFLVLTDQLDEYYLLDPDGTLLARAYAGEPVHQPQLRAAIARMGGLDVVRVLAAADRHAGEQWLTGQELEFVAGELAGRRAWAELWAIVLDLSPSDAVRTMHRFRGDWRPERPEELRLYQALAGQTPDTLAGMLLDMGGPKTIAVPGTAVAGAFSRSRRWLAVLVREAWPRQEQARVVVIDLQNTRIRSRHKVRSVSRTRLAFTGDTLYVVEPRTDAKGDRTVQWRVSEGLRTDLPPIAGTVTGLVPRAAARRGLVSLRCVGDHRFCLEFLDRRGQWSAGDRRPDRPGPGPLVTDLDSGRLALAGAGQVVVLEVRRAGVVRELGRATLTTREQAVRGMCFVGPDRLAVTTVAGVTVSRIGSGGLTPEATRSGPTFGALAHLTVPEEMLAVLDGAQVRELDPWSLNDLHTYPTRAAPAHSLWASADGDYRAVGGTDFVEVSCGAVWPELNDLAGRPMARAAPADWQVLREARRHPFIRSRTGALLEILRLWLAVRFEDDISLGALDDSCTDDSHTDDDISLGER